MDSNEESTCSSRELPRVRDHTHLPSSNEEVTAPPKENEGACGGEVTMGEGGGCGSMSGACGDTEGGERVEGVSSLLVPSDPNLDLVAAMLSGDKSTEAVSAPSDSERDK